MCRWLAYFGQPVYLEKYLFEPEHSLIAQSLNPERTAVTANGDGFGVGWYGDGWIVDADPVDGPYSWGAGRQVFSRKPLETLAPAA